MPISREVVEHVREATDIVEVVSQHVRLVQRGSSFLGLCPFHQDNRPSFNVIPGKGIYHCFACQASGDVFRFLMNLQGLSFPEAVKELAGRAGIAVEERELSPEERRAGERKRGLREVLAAAADFYEEVLWTRPEGERGRAYLRQRNFQSETLREARLGYAPDGWSALLDHLHRQGFSPQLAEEAGLARARGKGDGYYDAFRDRVMFPIMDRNQRVIGFGGRLIEGDGPKYINTPETPLYSKSKVLYGLQNALKAIQQRGRAILVEGYFDVLALHQAGYREAIATCGTALTPQHARDLRNLTPRLLLLTDADEAGRAASVKSFPLMQDQNLQAFRVTLPEGKDPDEYLQLHGAEEMEEVLDAAQPLAEWVVRYWLEHLGTDIMAKEQVLDRLAPLIPRMDASQLNEVATLLERTPEDLKAEALRRRAGPEPTRAPPVAVKHERPDSAEERAQEVLLWLLIHFPAEVRGVLRHVNPTLTHAFPARAALARLVASEPVSSLITDEQLAPPLRQLLARLTAESGHFERTQAQAAACDILRKLEEERLKQRLQYLTHQLAAAGREHDTVRQLAVLRERQALFQRNQTLKTSSWQECQAILATDVPEFDSTER